ncbi:GNAT family N-acetyltransferase [Flavobacterium sp. '19STA2R22 D10 B1']|uniref:GNAT family N-acetyltransferase n=1 Tax=Flavobacterium aerium TaxID=3037261 RepID=UPI00278C7309|nr:GNAT family N-acetyltransferase [Flavobacterium sp. '19STA2R22 D10 B1']
MKTEIEFKAIDHSDIDILADMMQDFYAIDNYPIEKENSKKLLHEFISNENLGRGWLILDNNTPIGYSIITFVFSFEYNGRIAFLDELYLAETARGKGAGKKAMTFLREEFLKLSLKIVYLEVENHNKNAQKLYIANDFTMHNRDLMKYIVR